MSTLYLIVDPATRRVVGATRDGAVVLGAVEVRVGTDCVALWDTDGRELLAPADESAPSTTQAMLDVARAFGFEGDRGQNF